MDNNKRKNNIIKNLISKRENRLNKKVELIINTKRPKIEKKSISTQTDNIKYEKKEEIKKEKNEPVELKKNKEDKKNIYKSKYYSLLLNLKNLELNDEKNYKIGQINKFHDIINLDLKYYNNKEIIFMNDDGIVLKIKIEKNNILFTLISKNIIKKIEKKNIINFSIKKSKNTIITKINEEIILIFKNNINYYFIN